MTTLLETLRKGFGGKATKQAEDATAVYTQKLEGILYDEALVKEFAPIFAKLSQHEGFDKVMEILETKERQLESFTDTNWTEQESGKGDKTLEQDDKQEDDKDADATSAEALLAERFKEH